MKKLPDLLLGGRVIVKVLKAEEREINGLIIPKSANAELSEGLVMLVDPEIEKYVQVGQIAVFKTGAGVGQYIGNEPHLWLNINEIWASFSIDEE